MMVSINLCRFLCWNLLALSLMLIFSYQSWTLASYEMGVYAVVAPILAVDPHSCSDTFNYSTWPCDQMTTMLYLFEASCAQSALTDPNPQTQGFAPINVLHMSHVVCKSYVWVAIIQSLLKAACESLKSWKKWDGRETSYTCFINIQPT